MKYIVVAVALVLLSCNTAPPRPILLEPLVYEIADLRIELRYIDEETLIVRHGSNSPQSYVNPYYDYPALITKKRLLAFEFSARTTESSVLFKLEDIYLRIGAISGTAKSRPYLENIWGHYDLADARTIGDTLRETLLEREFAVSPDNPITGYLVFGENYSIKGGEAFITMYVATPEGDTGELQIPLKFNTDGMMNTKDSSSSIFP